MEDLKHTSITNAIGKLSSLTGEDFHGYRSEIWNVLDSVYEASGKEPSNTQMHMDGLYQCPYKKTTRCRMDMPCKGCETWAAHQ